MHLVKWRLKWLFFLVKPNGHCDSQNKGSGMHAYVDVCDRESHQHKDFANSMKIVTNTALDVWCRRKSTDVVFYLQKTKISKNFFSWIFMVPDLWLSVFRNVKILFQLWPKFFSIWFFECVDLKNSPENALLVHYVHIEHNNGIE